MKSHFLKFGWFISTRTGSDVSPVQVITYSLVAEYQTQSYSLLDYYSGRHSKTLRIPGLQRLGLVLPVARMFSLFLSRTVFFHIFFLTAANFLRSLPKGLRILSLTEPYVVFCFITSLTSNQPSRTSVRFTLHVLISVIKWIPIQLSFVRWA